MPLYEYQCLSCRDRVEVIQRVSDPPETICAKCGGEMKKLASAPAIQFKGSGFYKTDYASPGAGGSGGSGGKSEGSGESGSRGESAGEGPSKSDSSKSDSSDASKSASKTDSGTKSESSSTSTSTGGSKSD